ncbi:hypothetical protein J7K50_04220 [bacterium]|nr:hypothetical protein [bacterium]
MAKIHCNLNEVDIEGAGVATLGDLIVHFAGDATEPGEVIYRIIVDGEEINEDRENELAATNLETYEIIEIYTRKAVDIAIEGLKSACELVPSIRVDVLDGSASLRSGDFERGYGLISDLAPYLGWYLELLTAIDSVFIKPGNEFILRADNGGEKIRSFEQVERMREQIVALAQAQSYRDHAAVADILEYEIAPLLKIWSDEVATLLQRMTESKASD